MLPKNVDTPRGRYLQTIVENASAANLAGWPMLNKTDYALVGGLVVLYSYIDLNLRRVIEVFHRAGLLMEPWKSKVDRLDAREVADAIQSLSCWHEENRKALKHIEELRGLRNMVVHFAIRRFPSDDAFIFIAKSSRDYKRQFGTDPEPRAMLTAVVDCEQMRGVLKHIEHVQNWLALATPKLEKHFSPRR